MGAFIVFCVENFSNFIKTITSREVIFAIVGIVVGITFVQRRRGSFIFECIFTKPAESLLFSIVVMVLIGQVFGIKVINANSNTYLNLLATMGFSWVMTRYSVSNDYKSRQKEASAISYKHSVSTKKKLDYIKGIVDKNITEMNGETELKQRFIELKHLILIAYEDSTNNVNDWENNISEELETYNQIEELNGKIENSEDELDDMKSHGIKLTDPKCTALLSDIKNNKKSIIKLKESIDSKVFHAIRTSKTNNNMLDDYETKNILSTFTDSWMKIFKEQ